MTRRVWLHLRRARHAAPPRPRPHPVLQAGWGAHRWGEGDNAELGARAAFLAQAHPCTLARLRLPWLLGTLFIELGSAAIIAHYGAVLQQVILLASFMPVISAIGGNVGLQSAAIVVRGLDVGTVRLATWWRAVGKELHTASYIALVCGVVLGGIAWAWSAHPALGLAVGLAMTGAVLTAALLGSLIPMLSHWCGFDPATTAGPFETACQDVVGFWVFLGLAHALLRWLS